MKRFSAILLGLGLGASVATAAPIIADDFEGYADQAALEAVWKPLGSVAALSTEQSHSGSKSVKVTTTEGLYRLLGSEQDGTDAAPLKVTFWMYDAPSATRQFNTVRSYSGAGLGDGSLTQIYAAGIYNTVTVPGEVYDATKYKARVAFGTGAGWFNLNADGAPSRSEGWHKFHMEIKSTTIDFYVDDILGRSFSRGTLSTLDTLTIGSGLSAGPSYTDDFLVVPEPASVLLLAVGGLLIRRRRTA